MQSQVCAVQVKRYRSNDKKRWKKRGVLHSFDTTFGAFLEVLRSEQWAAARWYKWNFPFRAYNIYRKKVSPVPPRSIALYGGGGGRSSRRYLRKKQRKKLEKSEQKELISDQCFDLCIVYLFTCTIQKLWFLYGLWCNALLWTMKNSIRKCSFLINFCIFSEHVCDTSLNIFSLVPHKNVCKSDVTSYGVSCNALLRTMKNDVKSCRFRTFFWTRLRH